MFAGSHELTVDEKGRIAIPARFRQSLADQCASQIFITTGPNPCLEIYPAPVFQRIAEDIQAMEDRDQAELLKQFFIGFAVDTEIDKQGRVLLPPVLRKRVGLDGAAMLVGQYTRFDLWTKAKWDERFGEGPNSIQSSVQDAFRTLKR